MKKLNIAYFTGTMKPGQDGVTRVLFRLIEWLNRHELNNIFISPVIPAPEEQKTEFLKIPSIQIPFYKEYHMAMPGYKTFEKKLLKFSPDLIHINSPCTLGYYAVKYGKKKNIPVVGTYHTHFPSYARYYKLNWFEPLGWKILRKFYNRCDKVLVPSVSVQKELIRQGFSNVEFLPHGVDLKMFNRSMKNEEWKREYDIQDKKIILYAGRLVWEKDLRTFAEVYNKIISGREDAAFVLAGDGPVREELQEMMPKAVFLGHKKSNELSAIYASSDIFLFPSTTETFGNVVLEAMASGIPAVCADKGGASGSVINNKNGFICKAGDVSEFSEKINYLLDDEDILKEFSENASAFAGRQEWDEIFNRQYSLYESIVYSDKNIPIKAA
jgi:phosphatidylinositol alpha 1,6-mannosyltransferase